MMEIVYEDSKYLRKSRTDRWWLEPLVVTVVLVAFVIYTNFAILVPVIGGVEVFKFGHYVSPIYSPEISFDWFPRELSPAFILIWIPLGFRATCYYCRRIYYRSIFFDPIACAINDKKPVQLSYKGENRFPFILNNIHRYFLYGAIALMIWHWVDVILAMQFGTNFGDTWGIGIGTILIFADSLFLTLYVFSCHSFRHLIGGKLNWFSKGFFTKFRYRGWTWVSRLNERHNLYFWLSAISVMVADLYIRLLALEYVQDLKVIF